MSSDSYTVQLEKKILRKENSENYYVFIIKIIDKDNNTINEIYTSINVNHGIILEKFNTFVNSVKKNINSIFEMRILGNFHKISYIDGNIIFKTEMYIPEKNYILVRLEINNDMIDTLTEINEYLKKK